jgi:hypothetical protein
MMKLKEKNQLKKLESTELTRQARCPGYKT